LNANLRKAVRQVHRWTGLTVGLVLAFVAITGIALLFRPQLEPLLERDVFEVSPCVPPAPLDDIVATARAAHPGQPIEEIDLAATPGATVSVQFGDRVDVFVHPCTAALIEMRSHWAGFFGTVEELHRFRFLGNWWGDVIGGTAAGVLVAVFLAGGIVLWWPASRRGLKRALSVDSRLKGRAFELSLHRTAGIYAGAVLLVVGLGALPLAFKPVRYWLYSAVGSPLPAPKPKSGAARPEAPTVNLEAILRQAQALVPDAAQTALTPAQKKGEAVEVFLVAADAPHPNARSYAWFDATTGSLLRFEPYAGSSQGNRVHRWLSSLHMGYLGGIAGQFLLLAGVLAVPLLAYTGIRSFLRGRLRRAGVLAIERT
jgi:vanillate O-demethylase ferredoxin subunit